MRSYSKPLRSECRLALPCATGPCLPGHARTDTMAPGDCDSGQFGGQAVLTAKSAGARFIIRYDEPNPELASCVLPLPRRGSYTYRRHAAGGTKSP